MYSVNMFVNSSKDNNIVQSKIIALLKTPEWNIIRKIKDFMFKKIT